MSIIKKVFVWAAFSATLTGYAKSNQTTIADADATNPFIEVSSFFDDFDSMHDQIFDWMQEFPVVRRTGPADKAMQENLKDICQQSRKMHERATEALRLMQVGSSKPLENIQEGMKKDLSAMDSLIDKMGKNIDELKTFDGFSAREFENTDRKVYGVKISLPGFSQDDVTVNVSQETNRNGTKKALEVVAKKKEATGVEGESKSIDDDKETQVKRVIKQHMHSSSIINGRKKEINYQDGVLKVNLDLPVGVSDDKYTMKFEDNILTLEFPKQVKESRKTTLKFSE